MTSFLTWGQAFRPLRPSLCPSGGGSLSYRGPAVGTMGRALHLAEGSPAVGTSADPARAPTGTDTESLAAFISETRLQEFCFTFQVSKVLLKCISFLGRENSNV